MKLQLIKSHEDRGNCRVYYRHAQSKRLYCTIDHGERYATAWNLPRFELHSCSKDGEPDTPVTCEWEVVQR